MNDKTKACYACGQSISVYVATCENCGAAHEAQKRPPPPPPKAPPLSDLNIRTWLTENGFAQYIQNFESNGIDAELLMDGLTDSDLENIGIEKLGDRKKLIKLIATLSAGHSKDEPTTLGGDQIPESAPKSGARSVPTHSSVTRPTLTENAGVDYVMGKKKKMSGCLKFWILFFAFCVFMAIKTSGEDKGPSRYDRIQACKKECEEGFEKYKNDPAWGINAAAKITRDCKNSCEKNPDW